MYTKDPYQPKYQFLINKVEEAGLENLKAFIDYSNDMSTAELKCIIQERNFLIVFDDMSADMISNKKFPSVVTELLLGVENYLSSIHHKMILPGTKGSKTKHHTLHHEDSKQMRASTNCH